MLFQVGDRVQVTEIEFETEQVYLDRQGVITEIEEGIEGDDPLFIVTFGDTLIYPFFESQLSKA